MSDSIRFTSPPIMDDLPARKPAGIQCPRNTGVPASVNSTDDGAIVFCQYPDEGSIYGANVTCPGGCGCIGYVSVRCDEDPNGLATVDNGVMSLAKKAKVSPCGWAGTLVDGTWSRS